MEIMYPGKEFSPIAILSAGIGATDTNIVVDNASALPPPPNIATIGTDEVSETIRYVAIADNILSGCTRGVEGEARVWPAGTMMSRNFTNLDYMNLVGNVLALDADMTAAQAEITSNKQTLAAHGEAIAEAEQAIESLPATITPAPLSIRFIDLSDVDVTGTWNAEARRIEF